MNFFKSILSDDPNPPTSPPPNNPTDQNLPSSSTTPAAAAWSFNGLIKTLATQSESVIEIYRRDLKEFSSGLQKETATFRDVASREIDGVLKSTAEIISNRKDSVALEADNVSPVKYSRFEAQLRAMEGDVSTYCDEVEDKEEFEKWRLGFVLKREWNETIEGVYKRVVPSLVDDEMFWLRYYYKVEKVKKQEDARARMVKRAISVDLDDEELSWDVDDEDEDEKEEVESVGLKSKVDEKGEEVGIKPFSEVKENVKNEDLLSEIEKKGETGDKGTTSEIKEMVKNEDLPSEIEKKGVNNEKGTTNEGKDRDLASKGENESNLEKGIDKEMTSESVEKEEVVNEEKIVEVDRKGDKESDVSIVSAQASLPEEEDMGWDEIEDVESGDEKEVERAKSPNREDLRKRLSVAEDDDEDLSWDIEDDDEPVAKPGSK